MEKMHDAKLRVVGLGGSSELNRPAGKYRELVIVEAFVEDLETVSSESCALL